MSDCFCKAHHYQDPVPRNMDGNVCNQTCEDSFVCRPCKLLRGGMCNRSRTHLTNITVQAGYWRVSSQSSDIRLCPYSSTCAAGVNKNSSSSYHREMNDTCAPNRGVTGVFCSLCMVQKQYFDPVLEICLSCEIINGLYCFLGFLIAVFVFRVLCALFPRLWQIMTRRVRIAARHLHFVKELKLMVSFYQIVTQIHTAYHITFPVVYVKMLSVFQIANGHVFSWIPGVSLYCLGFNTLEGAAAPRLHRADLDRRPAARMAFLCGNPARRFARGRGGEVGAWAAADARLPLPRLPLVRRVRLLHPGAVRVLLHRR